MKSFICQFIHPVRGGKGGVDGGKVVVIFATNKFHFIKVYDNNLSYLNNCKQARINLSHKN